MDLRFGSAPGSGLFRAAMVEWLIQVGLEL